MSKYQGVNVAKKDKKLITITANAVWYCNNSKLWLKTPPIGIPVVVVK